MSDLPAPLVPAEVDLRDQPYPSELFVKMAVTAFGMTEAAARALVEETVQRLETEGSVP